jgi:menaquinone-dependent protoporphyrinogen oxidase
MKTVLVLYATVEGQSRKVAEHAALRLREKGLQVRVHDVSELNALFSLGHHSAAVLVAPVHASFHPRPMLQFVREHGEELAKMPVRFFSLSLSQAGVELPNVTEAQRERARADVRHLTTLLCKSTGFPESKVVPVAGCLAYSRYGFFKRLLMRHIAKKAGGSTDMSRDHSYTDFALIDRALDELCQGWVEVEVPSYLARCP